MSNPKGFDFTKFVPGFDFLKNLTPGASGTAAATGWVAPTLDPEELDKRIQELKTVQFWLEQNAKAVGATIQALEVQRMTLATLKGMNMSFNDLAESLKVKPVQDAAEADAAAKASPFQFSAAFDQPAAKTKTARKPAAKKKSTGTSQSATSQSAAAVDPSHWWGALTDQFQHIAHKAMTDMAHTAQQHAGAPTADKASASTTTAKKSTSATASSSKTTRKKPAVKKAGSKTKR